MAITGIAIQGDEASCGRVRRFILDYGLDGRRFETYVDPKDGNVSIIITVLIVLLLLHIVDWKKTPF